MKSEYCNLDQQASSIAERFKSNKRYEGRVAYKSVHCSGCINGIARLKKGVNGEVRITAQYACGRQIVEGNI